MSFYSNLDDTGKKLYDSFVKANTEWITYIRPKMFANFYEYQNKTNRTFYKYEFYVDKYSNNNQNEDNNHDNDDNNDNDDNVKRIYKFLSKKLHPDRFKKNNSDKFFAMINKANDNNDEHFLKNILVQIDSIINFTDEEFDEFINNLNKNKSEENDDIFSSMQYKLFCDPSYKKTVNTIYMTEDEIIKEIKTTYDYDFINFYFTKYKNNKNIEQACIIRMLKDKEKLIEENNRLKNSLEELNKKKSDLDQKHKDLIENNNK